MGKGYGATQKKCAKGDKKIAVHAVTFSPLRRIVVYGDARPPVSFAIGPIGTSIGTSVYDADGPDVPLAQPAAPDRTDTVASWGTAPVARGTRPHSGTAIQHCLDKTWGPAFGDGDGSFCNPPSRPVPAFRLDPHRARSSFTAFITVRGRPRRLAVLDGACPCGRSSGL